jgi:hypothetical protein
MLFRQKSSLSQGENFMKFRTTIQVLLITLLIAVIVTGTIAVWKSGPVPALMATVSWNG